MSDILCIYHDHCTDGFGAAWALKHCLVDKLGYEVEFFAASYGQAELPDVTDKEVYMVDFSYKRPVLLELAAKAKQITIIDHHKTAKDELVNLPENVVAIFDMTRSGAVMTWEYFHVDMPAPTLLAYIQDRDLWQWKLEGTRPIMDALFSYPMDFETWDKLVKDGTSRLLREGMVLSRQRAKDVQALIESNTQWLNVGGHTVPAVNCPWMFASDVGHELCNAHPNAKFSVTYLIGRDRVKLSLRSNEEDDAICADVASIYGGGGHPPAAGCHVSLDEFMAMREV